MPKSLRSRLRWLSLTDAASEVARVSEHATEPADLLRAGLDGLLRLSVNIVKPVRVVQAEASVDDSDEAMYEQAREVDGLVDSDMVGHEALMVDEVHSRLKGSPRLRSRTTLLDGTFIVTDGVRWRVLESPLDRHLRDRFPDVSSWLLPENGIVVRVDEIEILTSKLKRNHQPDPREDTSAHVLLAVLLDKLGLEPTERTTARQVAGLTVTFGTPLDEKTVRKHLDKVPEVIEKKKERL